MVPSGLFKGISRDAGPLTLHWDLWGGHWRSHHADGTTGGYSQLGALMAWRYQPAGPQSPWFLEAGLGGSVSRSEEHTSELQSLMRISYAVFCLKKKTNH